MATRMLVVVVMALALGLTACRGSGGRDDTATTVAPTTRVTAATATVGIPPPASVTVSANATLPATPAPPNTSLPAGCDEAMILGVVRDFIAAFNRGDQGTLARLFPARGSDADHPWAGDPDQLRWFTLVQADPTKGVDALNLYTRETLLAYFAERHARHEQMRVVELVVNPAGGGPTTAAINFRIARVADDLPETTFGGKGGVGCAHGLIFLWSQGGRSGSLATPTVPAPVATRALPPGTPTPGGATLSARQAQEVAALTAFLAAYNAGDLDATLAAIAEPWGWSDCDYARGAVVTGQGRDAFAAWLRQRFADHDQLTIGQVVLGGQDGLVMGVSFARRTSDTLRGQGLPDGIAPQLGAKIIFDYTDPAIPDPRGQMMRFANGPFGGSPESCEPATYRR